MKKALFTLAIVLFAMMALAQSSALKVHNNGQISLQSATTSYGIQIPANGVATFEPNITLNYGKIVSSKAFNLLAKSWVVRNTSPNYQEDAFYVLGNGNVYSYGQYTINPITPGGGGNRDNQPIENATELVSGMKGYYWDSNEFDGITPEELEESDEILPEALEGILKDLQRNKTIGMNARELETVLPEAVRHDPQGRMAINYGAVVTVLVEAFKEQQAKIRELEAVLEESGLMR